MRPRTPLLALAASALLGAVAGCSSNGQPDTGERAEWMDDPRLGEQVDRICFASNIDNFQQTTDRTVILERSVNDYYLVETFTRCQDLRYAQLIAIDNFGSCLTRGDAIIASDSAFSLNRRGDIPPQRCVVNAIYKWDPDAELPDDTGEGDEAAS